MEINSETLIDLRKNLVLGSAQYQISLIFDFMYFIN